MYAKIIVLGLILLMGGICLKQQQSLGEKEGEIKSLNEELDKKEKEIKDIKDDYEKRKKINIDVINKNTFIDDKSKYFDKEISEMLNEVVNCPAPKAVPSETNKCECKVVESDPKLDRITDLMDQAWKNAHSKQEDASK